MGVALAVTGTYGLLAFVVAQRRRELGVRRALGAPRRAILGDVLRRGVSLAALGVASGLLAALPFAGALRGLLYDTSPRDPAVLAAWGPAWRAASADPLAVLRAD